MIAGGALVVLAVVLLIRAGGPSASEREEAAGAGKAAGSGLSGSTGDSTPGSRRERAGIQSQPAAPAPEIEPGFVTQLDSLWKRPDEEALLDALDKIGEFPDPGQWRAVSGVLTRHASTEARSKVIDYLLATGDAAPEDVRLSIYAAALDNRAAGVADSARLELQNITGQVFKSGDEARTWIRSHPPVEEEPPAQ